MNTSLAKRSLARAWCALALAASAAQGCGKETLDLAPRRGDLTTDAGADARSNGPDAGRDQDGGAQVTKCAANTDCAPGRICRVDDGKCVECLTDDNCGNFFKVCYASVGVCLACRVTQDCVDNFSFLGPNVVCFAGLCIPPVLNQSGQ
jgi:hypothetical protein